MIWSTQLMCLDHAKKKKNHISYDLRETSEWVRRPSPNNLKFTIYKLQAFKASSQEGASQQIPSKVRQLNAQKYKLKPISYITDLQYLCRYIKYLFSWMRNHWKSMAFKEKVHCLQKEYRTWVTCSHWDQDEFHFISYNILVNLRPYAKRPKLGWNCVMLQDNDPKHTSNFTSDWLKKKNLMGQSKSGPQLHCDAVMGALRELCIN